MRWSGWAAGWLAAVWAAGVGACGAQESKLPVVELRGDQVITSRTVWRDTHYRIHGNLVLSKGGCLEATNCRIELMCAYTRQFRFGWEKGGVLRTRACTVGGSKERGTASTYFDIQVGRWYARDTKVEFSSGIQFGWDSDARLEAANLIRGEQPDSIIVTGRAQVSVTDSSFAIALFAGGSAGGDTLLDLQRNEPLSRTFDARSMPGARYRLRLKRVRVPEWYLFFYDVRSVGRPTRYRLRDCPWVLPGLMGQDLRAEVCLPTSWTGSQPPGTWRTAVPAGTRVTCGTLTIEAVSDHVGIPAWGVYLSGAATDLTLTGPTRIAELMVQDGGRCRLRSSPGSHDVWCTATTVEVHGTSELTCSSSSLGWFSGLWGVRGQITAHDNARITLDDPFCDDLILITKGSGTVAVNRATGKRDFRLIKEGGPIRTDGNPPPTAASP